MKKIIILIPVFNDWESAEKLIIDINKIIKEIKNFSFQCFIINDASTINEHKIKRPKGINSLKVFNMKVNKGHARCNAFALKYVIDNEDFDYVILMDGDGEDRPIEIKELINTIKKDPEHSVVAKRIKRSEGPFFQLLYILHKLITYLFTGEKINFGNYSCLSKKDVKTISLKASLWSSYSGTLKKEVKKLNEIESIRGKRYFGPSKMSLTKLIIHSFSIIAVFKYRVFFRAISIILALFFLKPFLGDVISIAQVLLVIFCLIILIVSLREKMSELLKSQNNLNNIEEIIH